MVVSCSAFQLWHGDHFCGHCVWGSHPHNNRVTSVHDLRIIVAMLRPWIQSRGFYYSSAISERMLMELHFQRASNFRSLAVSPQLKYGIVMSTGCFLTFANAWNNIQPTSRVSWLSVWAPHRRDVAQGGN